MYIVILRNSFSLILDYRKLRKYGISNEGNLIFAKKANYQYRIRRQKQQENNSPNKKLTILYGGNEALEILEVIHHHKTTLGRSTDFHIYDLLPLQQIDSAATV